MIIFLIIPLVLQTVIILIINTDNPDVVIAVVGRGNFDAGN